ncbi:MAG TPA: hypothetical protein VHC47_07035, partial [Mucilaginibacter sp.]|nr:hypothetical protein [Mucilaginibacter sp.]
SAKTVADPKSDGRVMRELFREVAPDHDEEKVYTSDMKKIITWFNILKDLPEFNEQPEEVAAEEPVKEPEPVKAAEESAEPQKPKGKKKQPQSSEKK